MSVHVCIADIYNFFLTVKSRLNDKKLCFSTEREKNGNGVL